MNPTIYREMKSGEILKIDQRNRSNILHRSGLAEVGRKTAGNNRSIRLTTRKIIWREPGEEGFREAVARMKEVIPSHMIGLQMGIT